MVCAKIDLLWVLDIDGNIAFQFLLLWLFQQTNQCWFLVAIWCATLNVTSGKFFFQMLQGADQVRLGLLMTAGYVLLAVAVYVTDHPHLKHVSIELRPMTEAATG